MDFEIFEKKNGMAIKDGGAFRKYAQISSFWVKFIPRILFARAFGARESPGILQNELL